jgi:gas vesicle protein
MEESKASNGHMAATFTMGALLGASLGLLFAPKPGSEMVADLKTAGSKTKTRLRDAKDNVQSGLREAFRPSKETAQGMKDEATDMMPVA